MEKSKQFAVTVALHDDKFKEHTRAIDTSRETHWHGHKLSGDAATDRSRRQHQYRLPQQSQRQRRQQLRYASIDELAAELGELPWLGLSAATVELVVVRACTQKHLI